MEVPPRPHTAPGEAGYFLPPCAVRLGDRPVWRRGADQVTLRVVLRVVRWTKLHSIKFALGWSAAWSAVGPFPKKLVGFDKKKILSGILRRSRIQDSWVSFDFNVAYSSRCGYSLINTLKLKKKFVGAKLRRVRQDR